MSKLMSVLGIILLAIGVALTLVGFVNPAQVQIYGISLETAALLLVGGILSIGLGGVIAALDGRGGTEAIEAVSEVAAAEIEAPASVVTNVEDTATSEGPKRIRFPGFGSKAATATVAASETAAAAVETSKSSVQETIDALEQAKSDINNALGGMATVTTPAADVDEDDDVAGGDELYVVEEKTIRGRPARILSDNTVEAETDEGWMRFEDMDHLNEYLDAAGEPA